MYTSDTNNFILTIYIQTIQLHLSSMAGCLLIIFTFMHINYINHLYYQSLQSWTTKKSHRMPFCLLQGLSTVIDFIIHSLPTGDPILASSIRQNKSSPWLLQDFNSETPDQRLAVNEWIRLNLLIHLLFS